MKIIATSSGRDLDSVLDPRFGRCAYFAVIDTESGTLEAIPNPFLDAAGGAGTQAAQWVMDQNVQVLLTGQCGPKAAAVLRNSGIQIVEGATGSLRELSASYMGANKGASAATQDRAESTPDLIHAAATPGYGAGRPSGGNPGCGGGHGRGAGRGAGRGRGLGRHGRG